VVVVLVVVVAVLVLVVAVLVLVVVIVVAVVVHCATKEDRSAKSFTLRTSAASPPTMVSSC